MSYAPYRGEGRGTSDTGTSSGDTSNSEQPSRQDYDCADGADRLDHHADESDAKWQTAGLDQMEDAAHSSPQVVRDQGEPVAALHDQRDGVNRDKARGDRTEGDGATTHGNVWLRAVLGEVAWACAHTRDTYLGAQFRRLARRRGTQKAAAAVAHTVLLIVYHVLRTQQPYHELGATLATAGGPFDKLDADRLKRHHVRRLEQLGYDVTKLSA